MTISNSIRKASTLTALVGGLFAASTLSPRNLEAQQAKRAVAEAMDVYVMGANTTHAGLAGVPFIKKTAEGYTSAARLVNPSRTSILTMNAQPGDSVAFVAEKPAPQQQLIVGGKPYTAHDVVINGEHKKAIVVPAAEVYENRHHMRIKNGRAGVDLALDMNYAGTATHVAQARSERQIPVTKGVEPEKQIPVRKYTPPQVDTITVTRVDTVRTPVYDTVRVATPPPPPVVIREQPPKPVTHNQLDLKLGYNNTKLTTPDMTSTFKSLGLGASYTESDPKNFLNVEAGIFGAPIFKANYTETAHDTTTSGNASKMYINGIIMRRLGKSPLAAGIANEFERLDVKFNDRQELRNYTSGRLGVLFNTPNAYGQASVGTGIMIQDGSDMHTVLGPAWDIGAQAAFLFGKSAELGLHGNLRQYSNLTGSSCCEEVTMNGKQWSAGAQLKMFPLIGGANSSFTLRPLVGIDILHNDDKGTFPDPRTEKIYWVGVGINFGRHASEPTRTSVVTPSVYTPVAHRDTTRAGPVAQPVGVTSSYRRQ